MVSNKLFKVNVLIVVNLLLSLSVNCQWNREQLSSTPIELDGDSDGQTTTVGNEDRHYDSFKETADDFVTSDGLVEKISTTESSSTTTSGQAAVLSDASTVEIVSSEGSSSVSPESLSSASKTSLSSFRVIKELSRESNDHNDEDRVPPSVVGEKRTTNIRKEEEKRKSNVNPSVDEIISGIIQLIGGNVKLSRPPITPRPPPPPPSPPPHHSQMSQNRPMMIPYNPSRINNRGPPSYVGGQNGAPGNTGHNLPPNILIGPGPVGLPLPTSNFNQQHPNKIHPLPLPPPPIGTSYSTFSIEISPSRPQSSDGTSLHNADDHKDLNTVYNTRKPELSDQNLSPSRHGPSRSHNQAVSEASHFSQDPLTKNGVQTVTATVTTTTTTTKTLMQTESLNEKQPNRLGINEDQKSLSSSSVLETSMNSVTGDGSSPSYFQSASSSSTPELKRPSSHVSTDEGSVPSRPVTAWLPFFVPSSVSDKKVIPSSWSEEPPQIITKPEEPSTFDITVKHKIGPDNSKPNSLPKISSTKVSVFKPHQSSSLSPSHVSSSSSSSSSSFSSISSSFNGLATEDQPSSEPDIVYGRPANKDFFGNRIPPSKSSISSSFGTGKVRPYQVNPTKESSNSVIATRTPPLTGSSSSSSSSMLGRPIVIPVEVDEVRPAIGGTDSPTPHVITEPGHGSVFIDGKPTYFKLRPNKPSNPTLQIGSGVTVNIADDTSPHGSGDFKSSKIKPLPGGMLGGANKNMLPHTNRPPTVARRPPFRPRPNTPLVRIDTCIVGDDSTCGANLNEHCRTEIGISSCQCKPGFGRTTARGVCTPVTSLVIFMRLDKLGESKISFNRKLSDPDTEEFQYLEYESLQALNSLFTTSRLGKVFKGVKVNRFYSMAGKTLVNATIELDKSNITRSSSIKRIVQQELSRVIATKNNKLGDSTLSVEDSAIAIPRVEDINECATSDLNDCSKYAVCHNEFGGYRCVCKPGYEDKFAKDSAKSGRYCASCSPQYCSNRGECFIVNGERECRCRGNFIGSKCDIDGEVLGVAVGGSLAALIIIVITFLCLYMWNQRWRKEQQKMEAMSAGSGQTFSYVNKAQTVANYRCPMDDRPRWTTMAQTLPANANYNYYVNPDHLMTASQQHLYATPGRALTPEALMNEDGCAIDTRHYTRPTRSKSRSSLNPGYQTMGYGPANVYNETEFSTRETLYSPSHVILPPRPKYSSYN